jgi:hypothetical protein
VLLEHFFLVGGCFAFIDVVHDKEVFRRLLLQIDRVQLSIVWFRVVDNVAPVIGLTKNVFRRIYKHFYLVSHLDLESNERNVHLVVKNHDHVFVFVAFVLRTPKRHTVDFILCSRQVVDLPLFK